MASIELQQPEVIRSQLYELVWQYETEEIASACGISGSLLGRVCRRWNIPKPGRGYWQQIKAGQAIKRPLLPSWSGPKPDPVVLRRGTEGFGTTVPRKVRPPRPRKPDALDELRRQQQECQKQEQRRQDELIEVVSGPATRHVLVIEDWQAEHFLDVGILGTQVLFEDDPILELTCRYILPARRQDRRVQVLLQFGSGPKLPAYEQEPSRGTIVSRTNTIVIQIGEAHAAFICSALASGRIKAIDIEAVGKGSRRIIRWAKLCSRTHDGVEVTPKSREAKKNLRASCAGG